MKIHIPTEKDIKKYIQEAISAVLEKQLPPLIKRATAKEWLTKEEVKEITGYSDRTLQYLRDTRQIPFSQHGRKIVYPRKGLEEFLNENLVKVEGQGGQS